MKIIKILLILAVLGVIGGYIYYKMTEKHHDPLKDKNQVATNAVDLFKIYNSNEDSANKLYLDKVININGEVSEIEENNNRYTLYLNSLDSNGAISCEMDTLENNSIKNIAKGNKVNIAGFCNGINIDVQLDRCKIVKPN